ncbi:NUDIX domain-containing protein [Actinomyces sp. B33]|uniref:NUDIX hydrolase n=1 Tax=Actinomyces sp. B33 TaxID=2942131 RepID=UPI0023404EA7|nr:NUDIX domain-containing protein [Actinomyces sp. B33]MDC4233208.1 NUDIX domain-containing protein [Actinomyces sp. B33]
MSGLGDEWPVDEDGYPHRQAARVVLFDDDGRVLLARGHDRDEPDRHWWFTIGGGIETGESPREAAVREMREETGIDLDPEELVGPVLHRSAEFDFLRVTARQDEWFFIARARAQETSDEGWTDLERDVIDEQAWWDLDELEEASAGQEVYPRRLVDLARRWRLGWDGVTEWIEERQS